jgi:isopentenyl-diphosphate delta-isomerase
MNQIVEQVVHVEHVVLVDDFGVAIGIAGKREVHTFDTALHRAFSCHLFNEAGDVLVTRRALGKLTWPGVWTNSFCGHPSPDETTEDAIVRRGLNELGATVTGLEVVLPNFRYRAVDASGIVENEICPVYRGVIVGELHPNPDEVAEWAWVSPASLAAAATATPFAFSPWLVWQLGEWTSFPA